MPHRVLMNFMHRVTWTIHFIEEDCKTPVSPGRYYHFSTLLNLRNFVVRCGVSSAELEEFDHDIGAWARRSIYLTLSDEQYAALRRQR